MPFRPTGEKPVYCSNCFKGKKGDSYPTSQTSGSNRSADNYGKQFAELNAKLDRLIKFLLPAPVVITKPLAEKKAAKPEAKKPEVKKAEVKKVEKKAAKKKVAKKKK